MEARPGSICGELRFATADMSPRKTSLTVFLGAWESSLAAGAAKPVASPASEGRKNRVSHDSL